MPIKLTWVSKLIAGRDPKGAAVFKNRRCSRSHQARTGFYFNNKHSCLQLACTYFTLFNNNKTDQLLLQELNLYYQIQ